MTTGQRRRARGLCRDCDDTPMDGRSLCARHLERNRVYQAKLNSQKQRPKCPDCGVGFVGRGRRCDGCFKSTRGGFTHPSLPPRTLVRCACGVTIMDVQPERDRHARSCQAAAAVRP